jgi:hypothetical protein
VPHLVVVVHIIHSALLVVFHLPPRREAARHIGSGRAGYAPASSMTGRAVRCEVTVIVQGMVGSEAMAVLDLADRRFCPHAAHAMCAGLSKILCAGRTSCLKYE